MREGRREGVREGGKEQGKTDTYCGTKLEYLVDGGNGILLCLFLVCRG